MNDAKGARDANEDAANGANAAKGEEIPASIVAAWGMQDRPRKGPRPGLSLEKIVEAGVRVAHAEGLAAVSMHRVAAELGTSAMTLYRYIAAKDELLALMFDAATGEPPAPLVSGEGWREGLARWAWGILAAYREHPWMLHVPVSGPPITPNQIAWMERGLQYLDDTGLTGPEKISTIILLSGFVRNEVSLSSSISASIRASGSTQEQVMASYWRFLLRVTESGRFPALHAAITTEVTDHADTPDDEFRFGLERILDGIEVLIRTRR